MVSFCFLRRKFMEGYMTLKEASVKWGISERRIRTLCVNDRIPGASKLGNLWVIPAEATKPNDQRIKSGKYIKDKS